MEDPVVSLDNAYLKSFILSEDGNMTMPKVIMSNSKIGIKATGQMNYIKLSSKDRLW